MRLVMLIVTFLLLAACSSQAPVPKISKQSASPYQSYYLGQWQCQSTMQLKRFGRDISIDNRTVDVFDKTGSYTSTGKFLFTMNNSLYRYDVSASGSYYAEQNSVRTKLDKFELEPESETFTAIFLSSLLPSELALDQEKTVKLIDKKADTFTAETVMEHVDDKPVIKTQCTRLSE